jgi:opacity protein-like surface antigen
MDTDKQPHHGNIDSKMLLNEVAVGYQVDGWMAGQTFDLLVGVRTLSLDTDLTVNGVGTFSKKVTAVDPIFVVRPSILIFPSVVKGLRFNPTLAIGGGGDSKLVYEMQPQLQYQITDNVAARLGYRRVGYKLDGKNNSDNKLNFDMAGMIFGVGVTF